MPPSASATERPVVTDRRPTPTPRPAGAAPPPIRIRTLLAIAVVGAAFVWARPRAVAAWRLHDLATVSADYALCMGGPTGLASFRDQPAEFQRLLRRRLITADADERPFRACADEAGALTGSAEVERAHGASAWSFVEYGGAAADRAAVGSKELTLDALHVSMKPVARLATEAWPFVRGGYTRLVKPSSGADEATHPVELPKPALGVGLPAWRARYRAVHRFEQGHLVAVGHGANLGVYETRDGGLRWRPASLRHPSLRRFAERCSAGDSRAFVFGTTEDAERVTVASVGPDGDAFPVELVSATHQVFAASCDDRALVALSKAEGSRDVTLHLCPYRRACARMPLPRFSGTGVLPRFPMDVARMDGVTIVSTVMHRLVRVASTRDDGRTWTPWTVAFDREAFPDLAPDAPAPGLLLPLGDRLLLYAGSRRPGEPYPVLGSTDAGASWRGR